MFNIENFGNFKPKGIQKKKKQIILCHTSREVQEYLTSLVLRLNGKYDKVPNYVIDRNGKIYQLLPDSHHTNFFSEINVNRNAITIVLENLGWLEKKPLKNHYINWNGNIYNDEVYEKKWRDYFFWQPYTKSQIESTAELCIKITKKNKINRKILGHNTKIDTPEKFEGILCRSNFNTMYTDLNPSFNFENFEKIIENG